MSFVNEVFYLLILGLLCVMNELQDSWISSVVLAWVAISLLSLINGINLIFMTAVIFKIVKEKLKERRKERESKLRGGFQLRVHS